MMQPISMMAADLAADVLRKHAKRKAHEGAGKNGNGDHGARLKALLQQSGPGRMSESSPCHRRQAGWTLSLFTEDFDGLRKRTETDAEGAFDNTCLTTDVLGNLEEGRLSLA